MATEYEPWSLCDRNKDMYLAHSPLWYCTKTANREAPTSGLRGWEYLWERSVQHECIITVATVMCRVKAASMNNTRQYVRAKRRARLV